MKKLINDFLMDYIKYGNGKNNIIFLHGNNETYHIYDSILKYFSCEYTIYLVNTRNCKDSKNSNIAYEIICSDIISFIKKLEIKNPIIFGFSDGGIVALLVAMKYPNLVKKVICSGINVKPNGLKNFLLLYYKICYFFNRSSLLKLMISEPKNILKEDLNKINKEVILLFGKNDCIKKNHIKYLNKEIINSKLKIIKKHNHYSYVYNNKILYEIIKSYLE